MHVTLVSLTPVNYITMVTLTPVKHITPKGVEKHTNIILIPRETLPFKGTMRKKINYGLVPISNGNNLIHEKVS